MNPVTTTDLRLALARLTLLSYWFPEGDRVLGSQCDADADEAGEAHDTVLNAEIDRVAPLFAGILSREEIVERIVMGTTPEDARAATLLVCEAAGGAS